MKIAREMERIIRKKEGWGEFPYIFLISRYSMGECIMVFE